MKIVREVILRCDNCHCGVKVESRVLEDWNYGESNKYKLRNNPNKYSKQWYEDLLFTVLKNAK